MLSLEFCGVQKRPKEPNIVEIEKVAISLEFLGSKWLLLEGPKGPGDCIFTLFSFGFSEAQDLWGRPPGW